MADHDTLGSPPPQLPQIPASGILAAELKMGPERTVEGRVTDAATGKQLWDERFKGKASASPLAGDGKVYVFNEKGLTTVLKAADKTEILAENDLGEETLGTPAISGGAIFIRTDKTLFCIGAK